VRVDAITVAELPHIPIAEVARRWTQELGEHGTGEDIIRRTIWRAFWRGDLANTQGLLIPLKTKRPYPERQLERFTRAKLLLAFMTIVPIPLPISLERAPEIDIDGHVTDATDADYNAVADRWDEVVSRIEQGGWRRVYIDAAMIERGPLLAWCERAGRRTPRFWEYGPSAGSAGAESGIAVPKAVGDAEPIVPAVETVPSQLDWCDTELPTLTCAELWLKETICAGWSGTFEAWYGEAIGAGFDISERQFRELWNTNATDEMKKPGPKTKNMPELPSAR